MVFTVTIVRHGETDFNKSHLVHTTTDGTINETGRDQANKLGKCLHDRNITRIYSSDLMRCRDTAAEALKEMKCSHIPVTLDKRLQERDFRAFDGRPSKDLFTMALAEKANPMEYTPPGGETYESLVDRVTEFFSEILKLRDSSDEDEHILVFSHGLTISALLRHMRKNPEKFELENFPVNPFAQALNTARTEFTVEKLDPSNGGKRKLVFSHVHDVNHLGEVEGASALKNVLSMFDPSKIPQDYKEKMAEYMAKQKK